MAKKRVAIIGAGSSGLCSIKCCLDEGLEPVCFDSSDDIGGLWRFKEIPEEGRASIYNSVIINTSKEMMCFSDFPIPDDYPNYMHNSKILDYFRIYAKHFDLLKYIRFKTAVCSVTKCPDFSRTGQWEVVTETNGKQESSLFDAVLVCTGHHTNAHLPLDSFPGITKFKGGYFHSRNYKSPDEFAGKRVIVIGIGNSGGDIAVEISRKAKQVFLSTRRGAWIISRVGDNGYPADVVRSSRYNYLLKQFFSSSMRNNWMEKKLNTRVNHSHYGLKPNHRFSSQYPTVNDELPNCIISGRVLIKPNVIEFTETAAIFEDGSKEENIDFVVFATGYLFSFPFLGNCVRVIENDVSLYKYVFPPHLEKPTLAIIGLVQPSGAIMPIAELQARWATRVFKGYATLPSVSEMMSEITTKKAQMARRYVKSQQHTIQVDYIEYMDEVASLLGVKPNLWSLFFTEPKLAWEVMFGPCTPYQYRLQGPGKWDEARKAILTQHDRILKPLKTRPTEESNPMVLPLPLCRCQQDRKRKWEGSAAGVHLCFGRESESSPPEAQVGEVSAHAQLLLALRGHLIISEWETVRSFCSATMGNTTSERVSGERHSSKSHRSDGANSSQHAKDHSHKIMVGSTDDPNVFSTHDSKLPGEKDFVSWHHDLDDSIKPAQQARPTVIRWTDGGKEVFISGSFNNWSAKIPLIKSHNDFVAILDLPEGEHQYKFFVDGQWVHDPSEPVVTSQLGTINNLIHVKKSDFEVFDALKVDSLESSETSCRDLSGSPPGVYGQEMYVYRPEERFKSPPILPPHLLQVILNKDTNISCDPALLPEPNHVMLNHLYALSIKDGVMVLSATHRYKKKYVTTLLYKPI